MATQVQRTSSPHVGQVRCTLRLSMIGLSCGIVNAPVQVECYSGYTYAQEPRAFEWDGGRYEVVHVVKRWRTPTGPAFRVRVAGITDHRSRITGPVDLFYLEAEDIWTMTVQN